MDKETFICATCGETKDLEERIMPEMPGTLDGELHVVSFEMCEECNNNSKNRTKSFNQIWIDYVSTLKRNGR